MSAPPRPRFLRSSFRIAGQFGVYFVFRAVEIVIRWLPITLVFRLGRIAGLIGWAAAGKYRSLVRRNLGIAFGSEMSQPERATLAREHFATLGANLLCCLKLPSMRRENVERMVELTGMEHLDKAIEQGSGAVVAIAHLGLWEVLAHLPAMGPNGLGGTLFQPLGNAFLNRHIVKSRSRPGLRLFDRSAGFHAPAQHLRQNGTLGVLIDQHAGDGGIWTPLFGRLASTTNLASLLSLRTGAPVLTLGVITTGVARWRAVLGPPITATRLDASALTAATNRAIEDLVRRSPADWFWVHDRWKTPKPQFLLSQYKRGVELPDGMSASDLQPFEILVRAPNWLGDACMALPAVRAIKRGRPDARVTVLTTAKLADLWRCVTEVDAVIEKSDDDGVLAVQRAIRATGISYDVAVLLVDSPRSALEVMRCGIRRVVGCRGRWRNRLLNQIVPSARPGPVTHHRNSFLRIAAHCGAQTEGAAEPPLLHRPEGTRAPDGAVALALCAGAEYGPAKRWPLDQFAKTALAVAAEVPVEWTLVGSASETALGAELTGLMEGHCRNRIGETSLVELMDLLARSRLLLTNDTGTMHLAAALGTPVVAVFGSTEPAWTGPAGAGHVSIRHHVDCSPCFLKECPRKTDRYRCFAAIAPETVAHAVLATLRER